MSELMLGHELYPKALSALGVGVLAANAEGNVVEVNHCAGKLLGRALSEITGQPLDSVFRIMAEVGASWRALVPRMDASERGGPRREEGLLVRGDGQRLPVEYAVIMSDVPSPGLDRGLVVVFVDASERRLMALNLARMANQDLLTGLLNRAAFMEHLTTALEGCREHGEHHVVCFIDIDQFKLINDTCSHEAGDDLLQWVAALLRESVGERDTVSRLGGDEFVMLLSKRSLDESVRFVDEIQRRFSEFSFTWGDKAFQITTAVGLAEVTAGGLSPAQLLSAADHACYLAKEKGRGGVRVFESGDTEATERLDAMNLVAQIHRRLRDGSACLYAQEIRRVAPGGATGLQLEILLRFVGRDGRLLDPGRIIQASERYGLMPTVDRWVIHTALDSLNQLGADGLKRVEVCFINLSGLSLQDDSMLDYIRAELARSGVPPHKVGFEITETAALRDLKQAQWFIQEIASIGCRLSLDDFGTGAASYSYLKTLPVDYVKIDGGFVEAMPASPLDRALVESINQIAHVLEIQTVAECVASKELYDKVLEIGVDHVQGYWVAMPRPMLEVCRGEGGQSEV